MTKLTVSLTNLDFEPSRHFDYRLGEWCTEGSSPFLPGILSDNRRLEEYADFCNTLSNKTIAGLRLYLNQYYGNQLSERFWKIALTPFVYQWISSNYFKYLTLKKLQEETQNKDLFFYFLDDRNHQVSYLNGDQYLEQIQNDHLTHFEFQRLIKAFIKNAENAQLKNQLVQVSPAQASLKVVIAQKIDFLLSFGGKFHLGIVYGLSRKEKFQLTFRRPFSLISSFLGLFFEKNAAKKWGEISPVSQSIGKNLADYKFESNNEFEKFVADNIVENLPLDILKSIPKQPYLRRVKTWIANLEYEKQHSIFHAARVVENGGKWLSVQHGGCYGHLYPFSLSAVEYTLTDFFVSWGWSAHPPYQVKTISLPSPMLAKLPSYKFQSQEKILLVGTFAPIVPFRFDAYLNVANLFDYKEIQINFFRNIESAYQKHLVFRDYSSKLNNSYAPMNDFLKAHNIPRSPLRATEDAQNCKLVVIDHCGTTLLQTLAMNVPTVIFWEPNICQLSSEALNDFKALMEVGIWHTNEVDAAKFINANYENIAQWWNDPRTQNAVKNFCQKYALASENYQEAWEKFLEGIAP